MLTISFLGAVRAVSNYNVMGVAKATLEAGFNIGGGDPDVEPAASGSSSSDTRSMEG